MDFSQPAARRWVTETVAGLIEEHGLDCYRHDFNMDPLPYWRAADEPDRQGLHEIRHIEGLYAFWDELRRRFPRLLIDNCASGGRCLDYEAASRSIPLWRSDYQCPDLFDLTGSQSQGMGLGILAAALRDRHRRFRPLCWGDYYPLANATPTTDHWAAYQLHRPDMGKGCVVAFRRPGCRYSDAEFSLRGLDPTAEYELEDTDTGRRWRQTGSELMDRRLAITINDMPGSSLIFYAKKKAL